MFTQILVALDGSELSEKALPVARNLANSSGGTIHLIQAVSRQAESGPGSPIDRNATNWWTGIPGPSRCRTHQKGPQGGNVDTGRSRRRADNLLLQGAWRRPDSNQHSWIWWGQAFVVGERHRPGHPLLRSAGAGGSMFLDKQGWCVRCYSTPPLGSGPCPSRC